MRRRRKLYTPSTGHKLILLVTEVTGVRTCARQHLSERVERHRDAITRLAGPDRTDWAIAQLKDTPERVKPGWPNPCKAARMSMRRKAASK
jgi:hypothetical protein